ncbi:hypothetical protein DL89DRAFT_268162 [Linderina pennispora]|uniref:F-box domain-containing protein n=1 Tax=Linderina pennispora TaxID=61395 RepID=A0A1Y1W6I0_9FUNG|nr:uncharacterized protein DL89DRAFT_268162 [Linderina pennispora]ORX69153.1 hypothetical protein DL89DRAFT_268162 [Linderina pennispora]
MACSFQNLPEIVIGNILEHSTGLSRNNKGFASRQQACTASGAIAFISICRSWRSVARPIIFQLAFYSDADRAPKALLNPLRINICSAVSLGMEALVHAVIFELSSTTGPSYSSISFLSHDILSNACFPATMALTLVYAPGRRTKLRGIYSTQCIRRLAFLFPHLATTTIIKDDHSGSFSATSSTHTDRFANIQSAEDGPLRMLFDSGPVSQLTRLEWTTLPKTNASTLLSLLYHSRLTLESFVLHDSNPQTWLLAVQDESGRCVVYPRLTNIVVDGQISWFQTPRLAPDGVPFPALRSIRCLNSYPYANDIIFRGNAAHLAHVSIEVDPGSLQLLRNISVLTSGRFRSATTLRISSRIHCCPDELAQSIYTLAFSAAPKARNIHLNIACPVEMSSGCVASRISAVGLTHLQVLALPRVAFATRDIVVLASSCPSLIKLTAGIAKHDMDYPTIPVMPGRICLEELHVCGAVGWPSSRMSSFASTVKQHIPRLRYASFGKQGCGF